MFLTSNTMSEPFFYQSPYRSAFLANMAGRIKDMSLEICGELLKEQEAVTPISDVSLMMYIFNNPQCSIAEMARGLDYSHQRTAARVSELLKLKLIKKQADPKDSRCKRFRLTELGQQDFQKLQDVCQRVANAMDELFEQAGVDLMENMLTVVKLLKSQPLLIRSAA